MIIEERNLAAKNYVAHKLSNAKLSLESEFSELTDFLIVKNMLTALIETNAKGFRGVVLTALVGIHLDKNYNPLNNFYGCSPRAIFEQGIWYALDEAGVPCGKSDPLNVAKNTNILNHDWAKGKRPESAALAVVSFLDRVISNINEKEKLISYFFFRLQIYALRTASFNVIKINPDSSSRQEIGNKLIKFTLEYPESGKFPQFLVSQLLKENFITSQVKVVGGDESVFGTNTTSKKPADIWLESNGLETNLYEITVKPVNHKRLDDSICALISTNHLNHSVTFICRFPEDIKDLNIVNGSYVYKSKIFDFVDYKTFCLSVFVLIDDNQLLAVLGSLTELVKDKQTSLTTKAGWNEIFG